MKNDEHRSKPTGRPSGQASDACLELSDSKLTHSELVVTLRKLRSALTTAKTLTFDQDLELRYTKIHNPNPHFTEEMVLGRTDEDLFPADYAARLTEIKRLVVESGEPAHEDVWLTIDGEHFHYDLVVIAAFDDAGAMIGISCVSIDTTVKRVLEDALIQSTSKFQTLVNTTSDAIMLIDANTLIFDEVNLECVKLYGYGRDEFLKLTVLDISSEPDKTLLSVGEILAGRLSKIDISYHRRKDGTAFPAEISASTFSQNGRRMLCAVVRDVTERKRAEEALRESEVTLNKAQRLAKIGSWKLDLTTNTLHWSDEVYRLFGLEPQNFGATYEAFLDHVHPDDRAFVDRAYTDSVNTRTPYDIVHRLLLKDGSLKFVNERCETSYDDSGRAIFSIGAVQDITERKKAEEALRESEERFRSITENAVDCIFIKDKTRRYTFVNPAMQKMLDRPMAEIIDKTPAEVFGVEQSLIVEQIDDRTFSGETVSEIRAMTIGEQERFFHTIQTPLSVKDGEVTSITGIVRDITELRRNALALRDSEERFHGLFSTIGDGVAVYTAVDDGQDFVIKDLNEAGQRLSNVELGDVVGRSILEVFPVVKEIGLFDVLKRVYQTGRPERLPLSRYIDTRIDEWVENYVYKLPSGEIVAVYNDMTRIKLLESDLAKASEQLQADQVSLEAKSIALQEVLGEIQNEKNRLSRQIQANLDNVLTPLIRDLKDTADPKLQALIDSLSRCLGEVTSPFVNDLLSAYAHLTSREARICKLIREGLSSKEMAAALSVSTETIRSSRKTIRRKLRISKKSVDLSSYLQSLTVPPANS